MRRTKVTPIPFTVVIDGNEKAPYSFDNIPFLAKDRGPVHIPTVRKHLKTGDYSIEGMEEMVAVERKSLVDLFGTLGGNRDRFERELARLQAMEFAAVIVEADWRDICRPDEPALLERKALETLEAVLAGIQKPTQEEERMRLLLDDLRLYFEQRWLKLPPVDWKSKLNPKSVWGSIHAWGQRYPRVHWYTYGSRRLAEIGVYTILNRFWQDTGERLLAIPELR